MYAASPADFARQFELEIMRVQNIVLIRCRRIPFVHFNCVKKLGMNELATEPLVDEVISICRKAGVRNFTFYHIPHSQPSNLPEWLQARGFRPRGGWDRIYRNNNAFTHPATELGDNFKVEKVTQTTGKEWAGYIDSIYGLPTTPWLLSLVERQGWHHYTLRKDEKIVAVRTIYVHSDGMAWLGVEAPVPGVMAPSFDVDLQLCHAMVKEGLDLGVRYFAADIEAPNPAMNTPAYPNFEALGFKRIYFRRHYSN